MNESTAKAIALGLLNLAAIAFPAVGDLIRAGISALRAVTETTDDATLKLADEVEAILPEQSESGKVMNELLEQGKGV